jgi:hypothetical protein
VLVQPATAGLVLRRHGGLKSNRPLQVLFDRTHAITSAAFRSGGNTGYTRSALLSHLTG